jgi:hypothetical protein
MLLRTPTLTMDGQQDILTTRHTSTHCTASHLIRQQTSPSPPREPPNLTSFCSIFRDVTSSVAAVTDDRIRKIVNKLPLA